MHTESKTVILALTALLALVSCAGVPKEEKPPALPPPLPAASARTESALEVPQPQPVTTQPQSEIAQQQALILRQQAEVLQQQSEILRQQSVILRQQEAILGQQPVSPQSPPQSPKAGGYHP